MQRYKAKLAYDGSEYSGFQIQKNSHTVQAEIEEALQKMHKGERIKITGSGRTDAGVHAKGQIIHFDSPLLLSSEQWLKALNGFLPKSLAFLQIDAVENDFHARFSATGKTYKYFVYNETIRDPFRRKYSAFYPYPLNMIQMQKAAKYFIGTHDFTSFSSAKTAVEDKVRTINELEIQVLENELVFTVTGNGFLYNMVRIIVGTLLDVGSGKVDAEDIPQILAKRDRTLAGKTAPAEGLYLWEVYYH